MNTHHVRVMFCAVAALVLATVGFGLAPTPQEAFDYAKSVVLVKSVVQDNQVHTYVKEIWRFDPAEGPLPAIGSEYGKPTPYNPQMQKNPERDGIVFTLAEKRPKGVTGWWRIQVMENGMVFPFQMNVQDLRNAMLKTQPKA